MDKLITGHNQPQFAITLFDVNGLKQVNDEQGHQAGDQYLRDACKIICETFDHSPVYRFGGDEFVAISQGEDFERLDELIEKLAVHNLKAKTTQGIVIACGTAKYDGEESVAMVLEKADLKMYENKVNLKSHKQD